MASGPVSGAYGQGNTNIFIFGLWTKKKTHTHTKEPGYISRTEVGLPQEIL